MKHLQEALRFSQALNLAIEEKAKPILAKVEALGLDEACPICSEGKVTRHSEMDHEVSPPVRLHFRLCDHCGSEFAGAEEMRLNKESSKS